MRLALLAAFGLVAAPSLAQPINPDTVRAGRLDGGKMWLFEAPPTAYLNETYGFRPSEAWFTRARLASLRIPGCSASFVSPEGLIATNHHCSEGSVVKVSRPGEGLLDKGFLARTRAQERRIPDYYVDQAIATEDVTEAVEARIRAANPQTDAERMQAQRDAAEAQRVEMLRARGIDPADRDADVIVQIVPLYQGGRYSAYTYRRYRDVRLVMAPEVRLGFFGGDADNFTYPRYALDFAFMRVYDRNGQPLRSPDYFPMSRTGVKENDLVFVIGNPGSTSRGLTVAQLEYQRDVLVPILRDGLDRRIAVLDRYIATRPADVDEARSTRFGLSNSAKVYHGRTDALGNAYLMARRAAAERAFRETSPTAAAAMARVTAVVQEQRALAVQARAYQLLFHPAYGSATMRRALAVVQASKGDARAADRFAAVADRPAMVEAGFLAAELADLNAYAAATGKGWAIPDAAALVAASNLDVQAGATLSATDDPAAQLVAAIYDDYAAWQRAASGLSARESALARELGAARYAAYGSSVPPDATFSLRFTDGLVQGYPYNGTLAPPTTTLNGLYDRHASYNATFGVGQDHAWKLPERWVAAQDRVRKDTPLNFVSTSDTIGGNSGSPAVNVDLELVGLNFDRTIEGMTRDYLYWAGRGRNVMVDVRAIQESLRSVYGATALLAELERARAQARPVGR
ncbi:MAG: S46 family peptidase [Rhodothermales bacterium]|nr:S46 family peptidase [Rhodothermales bacterium]